MPKAGSELSLDGLGIPMWLTLELTYRCPLHCPWCSNPLDFDKFRNELTTDEWKRVLREGRAMGSLQLGFTGGEPMLRDDIEELVAEAHRLGFYTNLITSGMGLTKDRLKALKEAGLKQIQLSIQSPDQEMCDQLVGVRGSFEQKLEVAHQIKALGFPMVLNTPLCRQNMPLFQEILDMAAELKTDYLEFVNIQWYNWALLNRPTLLPTKEQLERAEAAVRTTREKVDNQMIIYFAISDYYENRPKACMNGWGGIHLTIAPDGLALPCQEARVIKNIEFPNVREHPLDWIWHESPQFNKFRGYDWMPEPCRSCDEKEKDFGGCRCQAFLLTGDAGNTDPVCEKSPHHHIMEAALAEANRQEIRQRPLVFRRKGAITTDFLEITD
ncbi:MAG: pyrroloquinoline quinone biosynthesis protein PqqE [Gammaproteobacteria bacterium]